ncbi:MAG: 2OG-Fe(II) oxygenase [Spongiibacter sp.]|uniref:2OG-Fe(II) oxygenase n=1 Tax=Spongiibacter sp. TaxID=2024860 RepID=UPI000C09FB4F|nr:2OG-Fe(II) oxygenase [Spongiibacter sp.]MAK42574.1 2OG-Fe(II) oxygenase [Spongiibacter sp.]|tara:strand:+ start:5402 stop:6220 length:819 start_codon:yes stop_codon:yes gene_type:complete
MNRDNFAALIAKRLSEELPSLKKSYQNSVGGIGYFYIDNLLPGDVAENIYKAFPSPELMVRKKSLREYKYIAAQMNSYEPILEEIIYAFQAPEVVAIVEDIVGVDGLIPDEYLYAGGISLMGEGNYLNPHLDNSHDKDRENWRAFNLLYYVTPDWDPEFGGNLELWPDGPGVLSSRTVVDSLFNRLAVMVTHNSSWHSVSPITADKRRCCVSNYYFSRSPMKESDSFHVTSFRGRPEQKVRDLVLKADIAARSAVRKVFKKGIVENPHVYKK